MFELSLLVMSIPQASKHYAYACVRCCSVALRSSDDASFLVSVTALLADQPTPRSRRKISCDLMHTANSTGSNEVDGEDVIVSWEFVADHRGFRRQSSTKRKKSERNRVGRFAILARLEDLR